MRTQNFTYNLSQLAALLGFSVTFFPGLATGANLVQRFPLSLGAALALGCATWLLAQSFLKWHTVQMEPMLEEIELPKPEPAPARRASLRHSSKNRPANYRPASINR